MDHALHRKEKFNAPAEVPAEPDSDVPIANKGFAHTKPLYSVSETIALLGVGRNSVYNLFNSGRLIPSQIGRRTLVKASEIDRFLASLGAESSRSKGA